MLEYIYADLLDDYVEGHLNKYAYGYKDGISMYLNKCTVPETDSPIFPGHLFESLHGNDAYSLTTSHSTLFRRQQHVRSCGVFFCLLHSGHL